MIDEGEIEEVIEDSKTAKNVDRKNINYLPHHAVIKIERVTTKCRPVFDGSAKNSEGNSLNDNHLPGANRQLNIVKLLLKFRINPIALAADISRMFYSVALDSAYRDSYRFLWNDKEEE